MEAELQMDEKTGSNLGPISEQFQECQKIARKSAVDMVTRLREMDSKDIEENQSLRDIEVDQTFDEEVSNWERRFLTRMLEHRGLSSPS